MRGPRYDLARGLALALLLGAGGAAMAQDNGAHDGGAHEDGAMARNGGAHEAAPATARGAGALIKDSDVEPFPAAIGGPFALVDHRGKAVTDADYRGRFLLIFFGYARCEGLCPLGLRRMTEAVDLMGPAGARVQPILISVDPEADSPEALARYLATIHPRLLGLTGSPAAIAAVKKTYKVASRMIGRSLLGAPLISHGSYIYLIGPRGRLLTVLPPVLEPRRLSDILRRYVS